MGQETTAADEGQNYRIADSLMLKGEFKGAIVYLRKTIDNTHDTSLINIKSSNLLTEAYWRIGRLEDAHNTIEKAIKIVNDVSGYQTEFMLAGNLYNNLCVVNLLSGNNNIALENGFNALDLYKKDSVNSIDRISLILGRLAIVHYNTGKLSDALSLYKESLTINEAQFGLSNTKTADSNINVGLIYADIGEYKNALVYLNKATDIYKQLYAEDHPQVANALFNIGTVYHSQNEIDLALEHYTFALNIFEKSPDVFFQEISNAYNNIGLVCSESQRYDESIVWHQKALALREKIFGPSHPILGFTYNNLGVLYHNLGQDSIALIHNKKALEIQKTNFGSIHPDIARSHTNISNNYYGQKQFELSIQHCKLSLDASTGSFGRSHPLITRAYNLMSITYFSLGQAEEGLKSTENALNSNLWEENSKSLSKDSLLYAVIDIQELLLTSIWESKLLLLKWQHDNNLQDLELALQQVIFGDKIVNHIRKSQQRIGDKLTLAKNSHEIYDLGIKICYQLWALTKQDEYKAQAFVFFEKAKAAILTQNLSDKHARHFEGLPDHLIELEKSLKSKVSFYQSKIVEVKSSQGNPDTNQLRDYENELFILKQSLDSIINHFEKAYPRYHELKYQNKIIASAAIQLQLTPEEALIEYFESDTSVFAFLITKTDRKFISVSKPGSLNKLIDEVKTSINSQVQISDEFLSSSYRLYEILLQKPLKYLSRGVKKLILIPSENLLSIPWGILLTEEHKDNNYDLPYLLKKYSINYGYSSTLRFKPKIRNEHSDKVLAVAPTYYQDSISQPNVQKDVYRSEIVPLKWTKKEIEAIDTYFDGEIISGALATEKSFKEKSQHYKILHLAMHTLLDHDESMQSKLVFTQNSDSTEDNYLHTFELFNMNLSAELAVLSACNTGLGNTRKGEGIISLAHGFAYAGVPSIVMSHWKVDDKSTSEMMEYFYKHLSTGLSKSDALRAAKLEYLEKAGPNRQHPFYWAAFVVSGDDSPITSTKNYWPYFIVASILLLAASLLFVKLRKPKNAS